MISDCTTDDLHCVNGRLIELAHIFPRRVHFRSRLHGRVQADRTNIGASRVSDVGRSVEKGVTPRIPKIIIVVRRPLESVGSKNKDRLDVSTIDGVDNPVSGIVDWIYGSAVDESTSNVECQGINRNITLPGVT